MEAEAQRKPYRVVLEGGQAQLEEKKSRFIATVRPVSSEQEAVSFIEEMKKKYWDARHNCSAFVIGERAGLTRCSDDGEPAGTAGRPMLEVLLGEGVRNVAVVVTRYFGGVLLGTGGLVRAYSGAAKQGLLASRTGVMRDGLQLSVRTDYNGIGKLQYLLRQRGLSAQDISYTDCVELTLLLPVEEAADLKKEITEATSGQAVIEEKQRLWFVQALDEEERT
ncbi:MAG: YigZ family protein [Eubacteriales bacterium]|nr:YigZ family protein [Eubacteriales bacterium]